MSQQEPLGQKRTLSNFWYQARTLISRVSGLRLRSETLILIATCFSAIAAGGSVWAALRQERATYLSQLYTQQVATVGPLYKLLVPFYSDLRSLAWQKTPVSPTSLSAFADRASKLHDILDEQRGLLLVSFPVSVTALVDDMEKTVTDVGPAIGNSGDSNGSNTLEPVWKHFRVPYDKMNDCVRARLQAGQAVVDPMCDD